MIVESVSLIVNNRGKGGPLIKEGNFSNIEAEKHVKYSKSTEKGLQIILGARVRFRLVLISKK